ncbi:MAG: FAD binding domain-containing protein, partial [Candidatus Rokuibacteriota bacterium]
MRRFELATPDSVEACLKTLAQRGADAKLLAGGTDLLPQLKNHLLKPAYVVDLSGVADLRVLDGDAKRGFRVGASVSAREIEQHAGLRAACPGFSESGALVGSIQVRNLATVGGNMCNAAPSADMAPPLVALEAEAVIAGPKGRRTVPMTDFFTGV